MPYIAESARLDYAPGAYLRADNVGTLTFQLQQLVQDYLLLAHQMHGGTLRYADLAEVLGAIEGAKADFIDRILLPYEACKAAENGDVWDPRLVEAWPG